MKVFQHKGLLNQHVQVNRDYCNKSNIDNKHIFNQIMRGNMESDAVNYLMNLGYMRLSDIKSIGMFNQVNIAAHINESKHLEEIIDENTIQLLEPVKKLKLDLLDVLERRKSIRHYSPVKMTMKEFSTLIKYAFGNSNRKTHYQEATVINRYYPSGGGLYPVDVYININRVDGIPSGLYKYQLYSHTLRPTNSNFHIEEFLQYGNFDFENYSFLILFEYDLNKNYLKYGELSLLNTFVEVGNMAHALDIISTATGFGTCQIAGFDKTYGNRSLGLDGVNSNIIYTSICGKE